MVRSCAANNIFAAVKLEILYEVGSAWAATTAKFQNTFENKLRQQQAISTRNISLRYGSATATANADITRPISLIACEMRVSIKKIHEQAAAQLLALTT